MDQDVYHPVPPKTCPICSTTMQAAETDEKIIHRCGRCGMVITIVLPAEPRPEVRTVAR